MLSTAKRRYSTDFRKIHNYFVGKRIGDGAFAQIRHSLEKGTFEECVVKLMLKNKMNKMNSDGIDIYQSEMYAAPLLKHTNIVTVKETIECQTMIIQSMKYYKNGDFLSYLDSHPELTRNDKLVIIDDILAAVEYIHSYQLCHRDIKPENCLIDEDGRALLCDFGFLTFQQCSGKCGSAGYAAPEVLTRKTYNGAKADVWSLGVLVYMAFAGVDADPENPNLSILPADIFELVNACLRKSPSKRPTVSELRSYRCFDEITRSDKEIRPTRNYETPIEDPKKVVLQRLGEMYQTSTDVIAEYLLKKSNNELKGLYYLVYDRLETYEESKEVCTHAQSLPTSTSLESGFVNLDCSESITVKGACYEVVDAVNELLLTNGFCISTAVTGVKTAVLNRAAGDVTFEMSFEELANETSVTFAFNSAAETEAKQVLTAMKQFI